ncbi:helix-turn-helix domain-containing protein [Lacticaseibacillus saniviri]
MLSEQVASRIHDFRLIKHLTQEQLAAQAQMDVSMLARIERGDRANIQLSTLERIIQALDITYAEFFSFDRPNNQQASLAADIYLLRDPELLQALATIIHLGIHSSN